MQDTKASKRVGVTTVEELFPPGKKVIESPASSISLRNNIICELVLEGKNLREIGDMFGITRERARQILKNSTGMGRREFEVVKFPLRKFNTAIKKHLWASGYYKCSICKEWKCRGSFYLNSTRHCKACNTERSKEYRRTDKNIEYRYNYVRRPEVKERMKENTRRYEERKILDYQNRVKYWKEKIGGNE